MKQKIINIVGIFFLVIGITLLLYPEIISYLKQKQSDQTVKELTQRRSKRKQDDLLYIEQLKIGDQVIIRNPWERLDYRVTKIKVIDPYDMDKILIQKGKDMVTLITCHPYRGHGRYRYVVYCMRNHGQKIRKQKEDR